MKTSKKILVGIIAIFTILLCFVFTASAETYSGDCGPKHSEFMATWTFDSDTGVLTISGEGAIRDYSNYSKPGWRSKGDVKSIIIEEGITRIGEYAFNAQGYLESVTLPKSLKEIGFCAFDSCSGITNSGLSITIPEAVTSIESHAFYDTKLIDITFESDFTTLGSYVFGFCDELESITLPGGITEISSGLFECCTALKDVKFPKNITSIGEGAFSNCTALTEFTVPDSVITIAKTSFSDCENLETVKLGANVQTIGESAFANCVKLKDITFPDSLSVIDYKAFKNCNSLKSITIPDNVTVIDAVAFGDCTSLENVVFGNCSPDLGQWIFDNCTNIKKLIIPGSVKVVGDAALGNCKGLEKVVFKEGVETIGGFTDWEHNEFMEGVFGNCNNLTSVSLPASLTTIGEYTFYEYNNMDKLTDVYYAGTEEQWKKINFGRGNDLLDKVTIHYEHKHFYEGKSVPATCTEAGANIGTCICGDYVEETIPATGHTMGKWYVSKAGTCVSAGEEKRVCTVCGADETRVVVNVGHKDADNNGECDECSDVLCTHLCHKSGFMGFIYKIVRCFWKLFKMNPVCSCGVAHY